LNEVPVLCNSIPLNGGKLQVETIPEWPKSGGKSLKLPPEKSILKLKVGDVVKLSEAGYPTIAQRALTILPSSLENPAILLLMSRLSTPISNARE
jgi:hypothetical protein